MNHSKVTVNAFAAASRAATRSEPDGINKPEVTQKTATKTPIYAVL